MSIWKFQIFLTKFCWVLSHSRHSQCCKLIEKREVNYARISRNHWGKRLRIYLIESTALETWKRRNFLLLVPCFCRCAHLVESGVGKEVSDYLRDAYFDESQQAFSPPHFRGSSKQRNRCRQDTAEELLLFGIYVERSLHSTLSLQSVSAFLVLSTCRYTLGRSKFETLCLNVISRCHTSTYL